VTEAFFKDCVYHDRTADSGRIVLSAAQAGRSDPAAAPPCSCEPWRRAGEVVPGPSRPHAGDGRHVGAAVGAAPRGARASVDGAGVWQPLGRVDGHRGCARDVGTGRGAPNASGLMARSRGRTVTFRSVE